MTFWLKMKQMGRMYLSYFWIYLKKSRQRNDHDSLLLHKIMYDYRMVFLKVNKLIFSDVLNILAKRV